MLEELRKLGAVDIIVAAVEFHADDEDLLKSAAEALAALAGEDDISGCLKIVPGCNLATANAVSKIASLMLVEVCCQPWRGPTPCLLPLLPSFSHRKTSPTGKH